MVEEEGEEGEEEEEEERSLIMNNMRLNLLKVPSVRKIPPVVDIVAVQEGERAVEYDIE